MSRILFQASVDNKQFNHNQNQSQLQYIKSDNFNAVKDTSAIHIRLLQVKKAFIDSAIRSKLITISENQETKFLKQAIERDLREDSLRRKKIGCWVNETSRYNPYTSRNPSRSPSRPSRSLTKLPSISDMLAGTSLGSSPSLSNSTNQYTTSSSRIHDPFLKSTSYTSPIETMKDDQNRKGVKVTSRTFQTSNPRSNLNSSAQVIPASLVYRTPSSVSTSTSKSTTRMPSRTVVTSNTMSVSSGDSYMAPPLVCSRFEGIVVDKIEANVNYEGDDNKRSWSNGRDGLCFRRGRNVKPLRFVL